jgi:hypothetical protein
MRTITTGGTTLFHIAAAELGDATQWIRIAQANTLQDFAIRGVATIKLPTPDPKAGGGIAKQ